MDSLRRFVCLVLGTTLLTLHLSAAGAAAPDTGQVGRPHAGHPAKPPRVAKVSPAAGPTTGGTRVTIKGKRFKAVTAVLFGTTRATKVTVVSAGKIKVTAPPHAAGRVHVRVVTRHGRSTTTSADRFTYVGRPPVLRSGSYRGPVAGRSLSFFVSANGLELQDISVPLTDLSCVPGGFDNDRIQIPVVPVRSDGTFSSTTSQTGILDGHPTTFTYVFRGHVTGSAAATGSLRESYSHTDTPGQRCTTNDQSWSAGRETQPAQPTGRPLRGSYRGSVAGRSISLFVSADGSHLQDISLPLTDLSCLPGGSDNDRVQISSVAVDARGSFSSTTTQTGILDGHPTTFTYVLRGHVHGVNANGAARIAGIVRESYSHTDTPGHECTTNDAYWYVSRDTQPAQTTSPPQAGTYRGSTAGRSITFSVPADGSQLVDVSVPLTDLSCLPGGSDNDKIQVAAVAVRPDGSFDSTTTQTGVLDGHPTTFTYEFHGHVHGVSATGATRIAGRVRESYTHTDTPGQQCTTNDQYWYVTRQPG